MSVGFFVLKQVFRAKKQVFRVIPESLFFYGKNLFPKITPRIWSYHQQALIL